MVGGFQRRIATADCVIANRSRMACPVEMPVSAYVDRLPDRDLWTINNSVIHAPFVAKDYRRDSVANPFIQLTWKEGWLGRSEVARNSICDAGKWPDAKRYHFRDA